MTDLAARSLGLLIAFGLAGTCAGGIYLARAPLWEKDDGIRLGRRPLWEKDEGVYHEPPTEPVPGATKLASCRNMSAEIVMDDSTVYFADCDATSASCGHFEIRAVAKTGGSARVLASGGANPRSLTLGPDALYYVTAHDRLAMGPTGVMKVPKSGGPPVKVADASEPNHLVRLGEALAWIENRDKIVEVRDDRESSPLVMGDPLGDALGLAGDADHYFVMVKNPSGLQTGGDGEPLGRYSILRQPREPGARARSIAQLDGLGEIALDAEHLYWTAPSAGDVHKNDCVWRMPKAGGDPTKVHCNASAHLSMLRFDRGRPHVFSKVIKGAEEITVLRLRAPGEAASKVLRWAGSYPGLFGYALGGDVVAFKVKGEVSLVPR